MIVSLPGTTRLGDWAANLSVHYEPIQERHIAEARSFSGPDRVSSRNSGSWRTCLALVQQSGSFLRESSASTIGFFCRSAVVLPPKACSWSNV